LEKQQKYKIEKMESLQTKEQRDMISALKREQSKELSLFNENIKSAQSELKRQGEDNKYLYKYFIYIIIMNL
jgi:hypothetical protein